MLLPCQNDPGATKQINPAIELFRTLDTVHPDVLKSHGLQPADYHSKLVFRSAIESIRGTYIASSLPQRHALVADVLLSMKMANLITEFQPRGTGQRFDFQVMLTSKPKEMVAVEVKGGEGNSINISERPLWANEFILWCHLDGAIVNQPSSGAASIIFNRIENEMIKRGKHVDAVLFKDARCNTPLRPCPKYGGNTPPTPLGVAPDVFLMPTVLPTEDNPEPDPHDLNTTRLPAKILTAHGVDPKDFANHVWQVVMRLVKVEERVLRETKVYHMGKLVEQRMPRR